MEPQQSLDQSSQSSTEWNGVTSDQANTKTNNQPLVVSEIDQSSSSSLSKKQKTSKTTRQVSYIDNVHHKLSFRSFPKKNHYITNQHSSIPELTARTMKMQKELNVNLQLVKLRPKMSKKISPE